MGKHQLVHAQVVVDEFEFVNGRISEKEMEEYVKSQLARELAEFIVENNIGVITRMDDSATHTRTFRLSLAVTNPSDHRELLDVIYRHDFKVLHNGKVISLLDLI